MKKLKVDELTTSESLTQEEKEALLGGAKGTFNPDLEKPEAGGKIRKKRMEFGGDTGHGPSTF